MDSIGHALEIVSKARNESSLSLRLGDVENAAKAIETGLKELKDKTPAHERSSWIQSRVDLLGDLKSLEEKSTLVAERREQAHSAATLQIRPLVERRRSENRRNRDYQRLLEIAGPNKSRRAATPDLHFRYYDIAQGIYQVFKIDGKKPGSSFDACDALLNCGLLSEVKAQEDTNEANFHLKEALRFYNLGCHVSNVYHESHDDPLAPVTSLDHDICANLFFAATRVCIKLSSLSLDDSPKDTSQQLKYEPLLQENDWKYQALVFIESGKAIPLLESLNPSSSAKSPKEAQNWSAAIATIRAERKIRNLRFGSMGSAEVQTIEAPDKRLESLRKIHEFQKLVRSVMNPWKKRHAAALLSCIPENTVVFEYALASVSERQGLAVLVMSSDTVHEAAWQDIEVTTLQNRILDLRCGMEGRVKKDETIRSCRKSTLMQPQSSPEDDAAFLYTKLLEPYKNYLVGNKDILFIPSGELAHIPWAMLLMNNPLGNMCSTTIIPSLSVWKYFVKKHDSMGVIPSTQFRVITNKPKKKGMLHGSLKFAKIEALHLARLHQTEPLLAENVPYKELNNHTRNCSILHIAAHGDWNAESPLDSKLYFMNDEEYLTVRQIEELKLDDTLVVFSACWSGFSHSLVSGSAFGFAHALLKAGARCFIGPLWPISDKGTLLFMMMFYEYLCDGKCPAEALQSAQNRMRRFTTSDLECLVTQLRKWSTAESKEYVGNMPWCLNWGLLLGRDSANRDLDVDYEVELENEVKKFRQAHYWAGFVLTGYGHSIIYQPTN